MESLSLLNTSEKIKHLHEINQLTSEQENQQQLFIELKKANKNIQKNIDLDHEKLKNFLNQSFDRIMEDTEAFLEQLHDKFKQSSDIIERSIQKLFEFSHATIQIKEFLGNEHNQWQTLVQAENQSQLLAQFIITEEETSYLAEKNIQQLLLIIGKDYDLSLTELINKRNDVLKVQGHLDNLQQRIESEMNSLSTSQMDKILQLSANLNQLNQSDKDFIDINTTQLEGTKNKIRNILKSDVLYNYANRYEKIRLQRNKLHKSVERMDIDALVYRAKIDYLNHNNKDRLRGKFSLAKNNLQALNNSAKQLESDLFSIAMDKQYGLDLKTFDELKDCLQSRGLTTKHDQILFFERAQLELGLLQSLPIDQETFNGFRNVILGDELIAEIKHPRILPMDLLGMLMRLEYYDALKTFYPKHSGNDLPIHYITSHFQNDSLYIYRPSDLILATKISFHPASRQSHLKSMPDKKLKS